MQARGDHALGSLVCPKCKEEKNSKEHMDSFVTQALGLSCGALRP